MNQKLFTATKVDIQPDRLKIVWADGKESNYSARDLRAACNCAACVSEISGQRTLNLNSIAQDIKISAAEPTGNYAVSFKFSDMHSTGIYSYEYLREIDGKF